MKKPPTTFVPTSESKRQFVMRSLCGAVLGLLLVVSCAPAATPTAVPPAPTTAPAPTTVAASTQPTAAPPVATAAPAVPVAAPTATTAPVPKPAVKIGMTAPLTGPLGAIGVEMVNAVKLYLEQNGNRLAGREVRLIAEDTESEEAGLTKVRKLVELDRVNALVLALDGTVSASRDYVHNAKIPALVVSLIPDITQERWSPYILRHNGIGGQTELGLAYYVYTKQNIRSVSMITMDYGPSRLMWDAFKKVFTGLGGKVVQEVYTPPGTSDFLPYLTKVGGDKADAMVLISFAPDAIRLAKQYGEFGLKDKFPIIGPSGTFDDPLLAGQGDVALGAITSGHYYTSLDNSGNRKFVASYTAKYGAGPTSFAMIGWIPLEIIDNALKAVNGNIEEGERFLSALRTSKVDTIKGPVRFDEKNNAIMNVYLARVEKVGGGLQNKVFQTMPDVDQYWTPPKQ